MDIHRRKPRAIHIVGRKNSGKTTLICELVRELVALGYRVGTIKHTSHRHELDTPGKDSQKHRAEGASISGIVSPNLCAAFWPSHHGQTEQDRYATLLPLYDGCDLVLVEGDTETSSPKVEVWQSITGQNPFAGSGLDVQAIVTDERLESDVPVWPRSDLPSLVQRILELAGVKSPLASTLDSLQISNREIVDPRDLALCRNRY